MSRKGHRQSVQPFLEEALDLLRTGGTAHPEKKVIDFIEDRDEEVPSHCLMTGDPDIYEMLADILLECILEKFPAIA